MYSCSQVPLKCAQNIYKIKKLLHNCQRVVLGQKYNRGHQFNIVIVYVNIPLLLSKAIFFMIFLYKYT